MDAQLQKIDHGALKANQLVIIILNLIAFILNVPWLAGVVGGIMLVGSLLGVPGFISLYKSVLKPRGWVKPDILLDNPEPHRFAQSFGSIVLLLSLLAFYAGLPILGWGMVWLVIALAALNAFGGFCAGCFVYYWLTRFGLPGFNKQPPAGTFPGMRPKGAE